MSSAVLEAKQTSDIEFFCPSCQGGIIIDSKGAGRRVDCPHCTKPVKIPLTERKTRVEPPAYAATGIIEPVHQKCPYCAESILTEAIKCKHCGEFIKGDNPLAQKKPTRKSVKRKPITPSTPHTHLADKTANISTPLPTKKKLNRALSWHLLQFTGCAIGLLGLALCIVEYQQFGLIECDFNAKTLLSSPSNLAVATFGLLIALIAQRGVRKSKRSPAMM